MRSKVLSVLFVVLVLVDAHAVYELWRLIFDHGIAPFERYRHRAAIGALVIVSVVDLLVVAATVWVGYRLGIGRWLRRSLGSGTAPPI